MVTAAARTCYFFFIQEPISFLSSAFRWCVPAVEVGSCWGLYLSLKHNVPTPFPESPITLMPSSCPWTSSDIFSQYLCFRLASFLCLYQISWKSPVAFQSCTILTHNIFYIDDVWSRCFPNGRKINGSRIGLFMFKAKMCHILACDRFIAVGGGGGWGETAVGGWQSGCL